jgi:hypothetical protein
MPRTFLPDALGRFAIAGAGTLDRALQCLLVLGLLLLAG